VTLYGFDKDCFPLAATYSEQYWQQEPGVDDKGEAAGTSPLYASGRTVDEQAEQRHIFCIAEMNREEAVMVGKWSTPVDVEFGAAGYQTVTGPFDAMIVLTDTWPCRTGRDFIKARNACQAAMAGRIEAENARADFLAAIQEAKLSKRQ
jgi:hypothetical protein